MRITDKHDKKLKRSEHLEDLEVDGIILLQ